MESIKVKTQYKCKVGSKNKSRYSLQVGNWADRFIEGKWYDVEYQTWWFEDGYRLNGGHYHYWVVNEEGKKEHISRAEMSMMFYIDLDDNRDQKINDILNDNRTDK
jgi:hypothetical protein